MRSAVLACALLCIGSARAHAHEASTAFLELERKGAQVAVRLDVALRDLAPELALDADGDGLLRWGELRAREDELAAWALAGLRLRAGTASCALAPAGLALDEHAAGAYAVLRFDARCADDTAPLRVDYELLFASDAQHRAVARLASATAESVAILAPDARTHEFPADGEGGWNGFARLVHEGARHVWLGFDHVLFLLALLLPAVLRADAGRWAGAPELAPVLREVLRVVTAFTLAHSLTLSLALLGWLRVPVRLVESTIALSVLVAALANLFPSARRPGAAFALGFGLVHGLGFASALGDLELARSSRAATLIGFNAGVELGQLAIVAAFLPLAWALRATALYRRVLFAGGSLGCAALALWWLAQRSLA